MKTIADSEPITPFLDPNCGSWVSRALGGPLQSQFHERGLSGIARLEIPAHEGVVLVEHLGKCLWVYMSSLGWAFGQRLGESCWEFVVLTREAALGIELAHNVDAALAYLHEFPEGAVPAGGEAEQVFQVAIVVEIARAPAEHAQAEAVEQAVEVLGVYGHADLGQVRGIGLALADDAQGPAGFGGTGQEPVVFAGHMVRANGAGRVHQRLARLDLGHVHGQAAVLDVDGIGRGSFAKVLDGRSKSLGEDVTDALACYDLFDEPEQPVHIAKAQLLSLHLLRSNQALFHALKHIGGQAAHGDGINAVVVT